MIDLSAAHDLLNAVYLTAAGDGMDVMSGEFADHGGIPRARLQISGVEDARRLAETVGATEYTTTPSRVYDCYIGHTWVGDVDRVRIEITAVERIGGES